MFMLCIVAVVFIELRACFALGCTFS